MRIQDIEYGPVTVCAELSESGTLTYETVCDNHGTLKATKQGARAHSAARSHLVKYHGYRFDWNIEDNTWNHDAPFNLYAAVWLESDRWAWSVLYSDTMEGVAVGDCSSRIAAQVMADLAIADTIKNGR